MFDLFFKYKVPLALQEFPALVEKEPSKLPQLISRLMRYCGSDMRLKEKVLETAMPFLPQMAKDLPHYGRAAFNQLFSTIYTPHCTNDLHLRVTFIALALKEFSPVARINFEAGLGLFDATFTACQDASFLQNSYIKEAVLMVANAKDNDIHLSNYLYEVFKACGKDSQLLLSFVDAGMGLLPDMCERNNDASARLLDLMFQACEQQTEHKSFFQRRVFGKGLECLPTAAQNLKECLVAFNDLRNPSAKIVTPFIVLYTAILLKNIPNIKPEHPHEQDQASLLGQTIDGCVEALPLVAKDDDEGMTKTYAFFKTACDASGNDETLLNKLVDGGLALLPTLYEKQGLGAAKFIALLDDLCEKNTNVAAIKKNFVDNAYSLLRNATDQLEGLAAAARARLTRPQSEGSECGPV